MNNRTLRGLLGALFLALLAPAVHAQTRLQDFPVATTFRFGASVGNEGTSIVTKRLDAYPIVVDDGDYLTAGNLSGKVLIYAADGGSGTVAMTIDTFNALTAGTILDVKTGGVRKCAILFNGTLDTCVISAAQLTGVLQAAQFPAQTGDVTNSAGSLATTIANNAVSDAKLRDAAALSVIGRSANSSGDPADIAAGVDGDVLRRSGATLGFGGVACAALPALTGDATSSSGSCALAIVNLALSKLATINNNTILGNNSGSTGVPLALTAAQAKTLLSISSSDVSGLAASATTDTTSATNISGGTLGCARLPALAGGDVTSSAGSCSTTIGASRVLETMLGLTDLTTADATTLNHGFLPKLPGGTTTFLRADGTFATAGTSPPTGTGFVHVTGGTQDGAAVGETGTANVVRATSPTITTPNVDTRNSTAGNTLADQATAPAQTASAQAGTAATFKASNAVAGSSNAGAAAGGVVTVQGGDAARLTSGNANGGNIKLQTGAGIGTGTVGQVEITNGGSCSTPGIVVGGGTGTGITMANAASVSLCVNTAAILTAGNNVQGTVPFWSSQNGNILTGGSGIDVILSRRAAGQWQLGAADGASPVAQQLWSQGATGTDIAGQQFTLNASPSTGTGAGGNFDIKTSPSGATGSTQNTMVDRHVVVAKGKALTDATAVSLFEVALPTLKMTGGVIHACVQATNGTDMQMLCQDVQFSAVNKAGTYTTDIEVAVVGATPLVTEQAGAKSLSSGTLANTWTVLNGTNKVTIQLSADTSLTPSGTNGFVCYYSIDNNSEQAITIL